MTSGSLSSFTKGWDGDLLTTWGHDTESQWLPLAGHLLGARHLAGVALLRVVSQPLPTPAPPGAQALTSHEAVSFLYWTWKVWPMCLYIISSAFQSRT